MVVLLLQIYLDTFCYLRPFQSKLLPPQPLGAQRLANLGELALDNLPIGSATLEVELDLRGRGREEDVD